MPCVCKQSPAANQMAELGHVTEDFPTNRCGEKIIASKIYNHRTHRNKYYNKNNSYGV